MAQISSISSSEQRLEPTVEISLPFPRRIGRMHPFVLVAIRHGRHLPAGALLVCTLIVITHWAATRMFPKPVAQQGLREKVMALTESAKPKVIIAGDSRALQGIEPRLLAIQLQLPENEVVNIAYSAADSSAMLYAYREFSGRFVDRPIMILNSSFFSVNDATPGVMIDDEWLWPLTWNERRRLVGIARATAAEFLPEKALWFRLLDTLSPGVPPVPNQGFISKVSRNGTSDWSQQHIREYSHMWIDLWYGDGNVDGIRWQKFETNIKSLHNNGVQIVLLEMPYHPGFVRICTETPTSQALNRLHLKRVQLCERLQIPLLSYDATCIADEPVEKSFADCVHLNRRGATFFTKVLAKEVEKLLQSRHLELPE